MAGTPEQPQTLTESERVTPVHLPRLTKEEIVDLPEEIKEAAQTLSEDVIQNSTPG